MRGLIAVRLAAASTPRTRSSPASGLMQALEHLDRRGLARAVRPEQPEDLAAPDLEADAVDGLDVAVRLAHVADR